MSTKPNIHDRVRALEDEVARLSRALPAPMPRGRIPAKAPGAWLVLADWHFNDAGHVLASPGIVLLEGALAAPDMRSGERWQFFNIRGQYVTPCIADPRIALEIGQEINGVRVIDSFDPSFGGEVSIEALAPVGAILEIARRRTAQRALLLGATQ